MPSWLIGSDANCDLVVRASPVSARHCRLTQKPEGFVLEDLGSTNGTYVNGQRIAEPMKVRPSDQITLGRRVAMPWPSSPTSSSHKLVTIGRETDNDIVLDYPMISGHHARLVLRTGETILEDLDSTNGTFVGSRDRKISRSPVAEGDVVFFGSFRIPASHLLKQAVSAKDRVRTEVNITDRPIVLGRDPSCEEVLDHPLISWRHARIRKHADGFLIEDLGSTNGTFVNGRRIERPIVVKPGDSVVLGSYSIALTAAGSLETHDHRGRMTVEAREVAVDVPGKRLIDGVSLSLYPSEFVGLMGPSGAGKSTLMNALNGYTVPSSGFVLLAGRNLYDYYDLFREQIGYVPQDDIMHSDLTVGQALYFTARLRLPSDFSGKEIRRRIKMVLEQLGLQGTHDVLIGSAERKGISGGERKRVNLAMELITDPSVLFLDEPTSGLSSEDALTVMKLLRELADAGKTILLTIHQPSLEAFRLMDNLVMVAKDAGSSEPGRLVYYGPTYPDAIDFFNVDGPSNRPQGGEPSPDEALRGLSKRPTGDWVARYKHSEYWRKFVEERRGRKAARRPATVQPQIQRSIGLRQAWTLVRRCVAIKQRDTWNTALLMLQAPIIAALIVLVFGKEASREVAQENWPSVASAVATTVFLLALAALWFGCSNSAREIVAERAIFRRERMVNLKLPSYVASKFAVLGGLCVIQCAVLLGIVYWGNGLEGPWKPMYAILLMASCVGVGMGLTVSALARTSEVATAILPIVILPMVIMGGILQPVQNMNTASHLLSHLMPSRWAFEALLLLESDARPRLETPRPPDGDAVEDAQKISDSRDMAEPFFPAESARMGVRASVICLSAMLVLSIGAIGYILRSRDIH